MIVISARESEREKEKVDRIQCISVTVNSTLQHCTLLGEFKECCILLTADKATCECVSECVLFKSEIPLRGDDRPVVVMTTLTTSDDFISANATLF